MNSIILDRFNALESQLLENPIVISYKIIRREVAYNEGKLRFKATFIDGSMAEFFEYLVITGGDNSSFKIQFSLAGCPRETEISLG